MKANIKQIRKKRIYSLDFKRNLVNLFEKGTYSVPQLEKIYGVSNNLIYNWIYKFSTFNEQGSRIVEMKDSSTKKLSELEQKVKELERAIGQKQIKIDYLEKMIDIAKDDLNIDIKKTSTPYGQVVQRKQRKISFSMNQLYKVTGISKQAVHQYAIRQTLFDEKVADLMLDAQDLRKEHPGCGVKKMYNTLTPNFIGRDRFIELFMELGFRLKRKKNYRRTTYGSSIYFPNLIQGMKIRSPSTVWQSDITYIDLGQRFYYAVFIIDVYTKKIVGYCVSDHMRATANLSALKMALNDNPPPKIHHSDRGSQYTCKEYINLLKENKCKISMSLCAQDNAYAERINRTIKEEYLQYWIPKDFSHLKRLTKKAVENYNSKRPHNNLVNQSPISFEQKWHNLEDNEKPELVIFDSR